MKNKILLLLISFNCFVAFSQSEVTWEDLADVKFEKKYMEQYDDYFLYPQFGPSVRAMEGQKITITGFFLDLYPDDDIYVLSKGPMSSCFFCGVGGPETAIELHFTNKPSFKTDDIITVTGTLVLNSDDMMHFNYILKNCKEK